jgi:2-methylcitrate dehydratase PrpD
LAQRVGYRVDPGCPGPGRFKGAVRITLHDGRVIEETQEHNLGSPGNPMNEAQLRAKFDENAGGILSAAERDRLATEIDRLEHQDDASVIVEWSMPLLRRL